MLCQRRLLAGAAIRETSESISLRPLSASGCLYKSGKDETKEEVGPVVGGRASLSPGVLTDPGQLRVKVPAQETDSGPLQTAVKRVSKKIEALYVEVTAWGDAFCLHKHGNW